MKQLLVQGDVYLIRQEKLPDNLEIKHCPQRGIVLALGEVTGHAHVIQDEIEAYEDADGTIWLKNSNAVTLTHEEHSAITIDPGVWKVGRVLEYDPFAEEARRVTD